MSVMESVQKARDNYKSLLEKAKELDEEARAELYAELQAILGQYVDFSGSINQAKDGVLEARNCASTIRL